MDPLSIGAMATSIINMVSWDKVREHLLQDGTKTLDSITADSAKKGLLSFFKTSEIEKRAKEAVELFTHEFMTELEDKSVLTAAIQGYQDDLKTLITSVAPEIVSWLRPDVQNVDLEPVRRRWAGLKLHDLPEGFDWSLVAGNYTRALRRLVKQDEALRKQLNIALAEQQTDYQKQLVEALPPQTGFDLKGYKDYLRKRSAQLRLSPIHTSTYDKRVQLWSVFIPQNARESVPTRDLPQEFRRKLRAEGHLPDKKENDRDLEEQRIRYSNSPAGPVFDILKRERLVVVLGDPGSGKTSLLKYVAMRWVNGESAPIPIWIDLREYSRDPKGVLQFCSSDPAVFALDEKDLDKQLKAGTASFMLDGLDEIFDPQTRGKVLAELVALSSRYPQAKIIVTSRIIGYDHEQLGSAGFSHATLEDFDDPQIERFLAVWHDAAEEDARQRGRLISQLQRALRDARGVRDLAGNPLLLTMMAILNRNQELPRDRLELYREASRVLLQEWETHKFLPPGEFGRQEKEELLRELAGKMQEGDGLAGNLIGREELADLIQKFLADRGVAGPRQKADQLIKQLTERNFILCFAGANRFAFVHRTFLEYFCAAWVVDQFEKKRVLTADELRTRVFGAHWRHEAWHEVLRLVAGMVGDGTAKDLIEFLRSMDGTHHQYANFFLAAGCLSEVRNRQRIKDTDVALRRDFESIVIRYFWPPSYGPWEEKTFAEPVRSKAIRWLANVWRDEIRGWLAMRAQRDFDPIVRRAAVQELARGWKEDPEMLPWLKDLARSDANYDVRLAAVQELAAGWKEDPEMPSWLRKYARLRSDSGAEIAAIQELARSWKEDPETLPLLKDLARYGGLSVRGMAVQELARGWKGDPETLPLVMGLVRSDDTINDQVAGVHELARGWKDDPDTPPLLKRIARDEEASTRKAAVQELARSWKDDPETLPLLKHLARSDWEHEVWMAAVEELGRGWKDDPETLPLLRARARSNAEFGRSEAVQELARGWKDDPGTLPLLKDLARSDADGHVRRSAVEELARGWKDDIDTLLLLRDRACADADKYVRRAAVRDLARGWKENPETLPLLKDRGRYDSNREVRVAAVEELARGWKDDIDALPLLRDRACADADKYVRSASVLALAQCFKDSSETLPLLKDLARSDEDGEVRSAAVRELARGWNEHIETLPVLKDRGRYDPNHEVRMAVVEELARGWRDDPDTLPFLRDRARSDRIKEVRMRAIEELARGWKDDPQTGVLLRNRARSDEDTYVRKAAVQALARGWKHDHETLLLLKDLARADADKYVRSAAVQELARGWKGDPEALPLVMGLARSDAEYGRREAVQELAWGWKENPETLPLLKDLARADADKYVRRAAVQGLARCWKDAPETLPLLKDLARSDPDEYVRKAAARELAALEQAARSSSNGSGLSRIV